MPTATADVAHAQAIRRKALGRERARAAYEKDCKEREITPNPLYLIGMHFYDLRAKALTDLKRQRGAAAAQSLAGHTTESMTAHYTKSREVERVQPVPLTRLS